MPIRETKPFTIARDWRDSNLTTAASDPRTDTLRIAQPAVEIPLPESASDQAEKQTIAALIYEPLVTLRNCHPEPGLAESWTVEDDGRRWIFHLRENAQFHDGRACTAEDVLYACRRLMDAEGPFEMEGPYVPYFGALHLEATDRHTVTMVSEEPMSYIPEVCAGVVVGEGPGLGTLPVGTGPYRVEAYTPGDSLTLVATDSAGDRRYPRIVIQQVEEPEDRLRAIQSGEVDLATGLETLPHPVDLSGLTARKSLNTLSVTGFFNGFSEPFKDSRARLAINLAVDVGAIIDEVWGGMAVPAATIVSPNHLGYPQGLVPHPYDPVAATRLLENVEMPSVLEVRTPHIIPDRALQVTEMIVDQLGAIGVRLRVDDQEDRPKYAQEVGSKHIGHLSIFDSSPLSTYRVMWEKISSRARGLWWQGVVDETADILIEEAARAHEPNDQEVAYGEALSWLHENPPWLYLYHPIKLWAHKTHVSGVEMDAGGMLRLTGRE